MTDIVAPPVDPIAALGHVLALDPSAAMPFLARAGMRQGAASAPARPSSLSPAPVNLRVIDVQGVLSQRGIPGWEDMFDGYDLIRTRFGAAMDDPDVDGVVLRMDTPGGDAAGLFEAVRSMRAAKAAADKPVVVAVDELAASAGYAMATVGDEIHVTPEARVGSIGTIMSHIDMSRMLDRVGITRTYIADPAGKAAGWGTLDDEARARYQGDVSRLSNTFYQTVASARGMAPDTVREFNARTFAGQAAVDAKLADRVASWGDTITRAWELARQSREKRMGTSAVRELLALPETASAADIEQAARAAAPILQLGRAVLAKTGATTAAEAQGVVSAWSEVQAKHAELLEQEKARQAAADNEERLALCTALVVRKGFTPAAVWQGGDKTKGPATIYAAQALETLRGYVNSLPDAAKSMPVLGTVTEAAGGAAEPTEAEVDAFAKKNSVRLATARARLREMARNGEVG